MNGSQQKDVVFTNCPKDGKNAMERSFNKVLFVILPNSTCFFRKRIAFHICTPGMSIELFPIHRRVGKVVETSQARHDAYITDIQILNT